jgi:hypothetical protein
MLVRHRRWARRRISDLVGDPISGARRWFARGAPVALALALLPPGGRDTAPPTIVWKGIDCGPGPIAPMAPRLGSGVGPEPPRDGFTIREGPDEPAPPRPAPPACRPPDGSRETAPRP